MAKEDSNSNSGERKSTERARKAQIKLGNIELDCYQKPSGELFLSNNQIAETFGIRHSRLAELRELKVAKTIAPQGFRAAKFVSHT